VRKRLKIKNRLSEVKQILEQVFKMPKKKVITIDLCEDNETCEDIKTPIDKNKFISDIHNDKVVLVWPFRPIADVRQVTIHNGDAFRVVNNEWLNDSFIEFGVWHFLLHSCSNREKAANVHLNFHFSIISCYLSCVLITFWTSYVCPKRCLPWHICDRYNKILFFVLYGQKYQKKRFSIYLTN
jgi:hypothetical protein